MKPSRHRALRAALGVSAALVTVVLAAAPAEAHARVVRTTPTNGATINGRISSVTIVFDDQDVACGRCGHGGYRMMCRQSSGRAAAPPIGAERRQL